MSISGPRDFMVGIDYSGLFALIRPARGPDLARTRLISFFTQYYDTARAWGELAGVLIERAGGRSRDGKRGLFRGGTSPRGPRGDQSGR